MRESHDQKLVGVPPGLQWRVVNEYGWDSVDSFSNSSTTRAMFCQDRRQLGSIQWAQRATYWDLDIQSGLGENRMTLIKPFVNLQKAGVKVAYRSDWPVAPLDPFLALMVGVVRSR